MTIDLVTIIWYLTTFVALIVFFIVMICADTACGRRRKPEPTPRSPPPTPAPSYRLFAPPSYDTAIKKNIKIRPSIFILPVNNSNNDESINKPEEELSDVTEIIVHDSATNSTQVR